MVGSVKDLAERECLELLASRVVGRVALVVAGEARVFPVNYLLDGGGSSSEPTREPSSTPPVQARWARSKSMTVIRCTTPVGA
jgi:pyridoxamine 5'-phosphate oxidase-like protein